MVLYFFMVTTYKLYLPKYADQGVSISRGSVIAHLQPGNNANNTYVLVYGGFKSVPENKRKAIAILIKTASLAFLLLFAATGLSGLSSNTSAALNFIVYPHRNFYLNFCVLRI